MAVKKPRLRFELLAKKILADRGKNFDEWLEEKFAELVSENEEEVLKKW